VAFRQFEPALVAKYPILSQTEALSFDWVLHLAGCWEAGLKWEISRWVKFVGSVAIIAGSLWYARSRCAAERSWPVRDHSARV